MTQDVASKLAEHASSLRLKNMSTLAVEATKRDIFDGLSTGIAGSSASGISEMLNLAEEWGGNPQATVFCFGKKFPAHIAAWLNTVMIHGYDYDDNHDVAMLHCGTVSIASALAAAEMIGGVSGADLLAGIAAGLDIHCRLGLATTIGIVESGWVYTELLGIFGGVAAAGRVMGLTKDEMVNAFGIAYSQAAGNYQVITDSAQTKRMQPGFASKAALISCEMARKGIYGVQNTFEGKYGLYNVYMNGRYNPEALTADLGVKFAQEDLGFKPWPCGRPLHPPIDVSLEAWRKFRLDPNKIKHVEIRMNEHLYVCGCTPVEVRKHPTTIVEGQFSIPYTAACALVNGKVGLSDFTKEGLKRPDVLAMTTKIDGVIDEEIEKNFRAKVCPVVIKIETVDGEILEHHLNATLGCKEKPMTEADIAAKMNDCIAFSALAMPDDTASKISDLVKNIESLKNSNEIIRAMQAKTTLR
jgi:2-methylcitrate dehydratase PrpD